MAGLQSSNGIFPSIARVRTGFTLTFMGLLLLILGAKPEWFGLDRSAVVGFVQIAVFLIGLALICVGGYISLATLWAGGERSIAADFGLRLVGTGYVIAIFAGMADIFGMGSHPLPGVPHFGPWQARGVEFGMLIVLAGFLLMVPYRRKGH